MRVLIVDDDETFREELSALLGRSGQDVREVPSVAEAIAELEGGEFDVMFTDLRMGRKSGVELLGIARARWPRMLVVMLTGRATIESAIRALQLGAFDYLRKPVRPEQVDRVLGLVGQQLALVRTGAKPIDPSRYARALAADGGYEVLLIAPSQDRVATDGVRYEPLDADNPDRIQEAVDEFVGSRARAAVVLGAVEELLARHREEDIARLLERIRALLEGKGPLAVGYDPDRITATGALAVRASIVSADAHATLQSLASPVRRLVLHRLSEGSATFTQAMEAARLDDASLIAFHLRKLTESGLVAHVARERYRLTARGKGAVRVLNSVDELDAGKGSGNRIFPSRPRRKTSS
ncbi:MAG TPA: response regulator [Thermoplasmata archaeon]|nr:response regulator [Thermoplasmata archaeon]